jgi:hypothetical protein
LLYSIFVIGYLAAVLRYLCADAAGQQGYGTPHNGFSERRSVDPHAQRVYTPASDHTAFRSHPCLTDQTADGIREVTGHARPTDDYPAWASA